MRLIKSIGKEANINYQVIERVSGVIFNAQSKIALLTVKKNNYHVLPGGGIECGENKVTALLREVKEEVGVSIKNIMELGYVDEFINERKLKRITYCFFAEISGESGIPSFTEEELYEGYELQWVNLNDALLTIENDLANYSEIVKVIKKQSFVPHREAEFLKAVLIKK